jgi:hypothetical protein
MALVRSAYLSSCCLRIVWLLCAATAAITTVGTAAAAALHCLCKAYWCLLLSILLKQAVSVALLWAC